MAQTAKHMRASAIVELDEAIRQAKRYMNSNQPSTRILNQRVKKIRESEENFIGCHYAFCEKSSIEVESDESLKYLRPKLDEAMDVIDRCSEFVEEKERNDVDAINKDSEAAMKEEEKRRVDSQFQKYLTEVTIEERMAKDLIGKINVLVNEDTPTVPNAMLMKAYVDDLSDVQRKLPPLWRQMIDIDQTDGQRKRLGEEIFLVKTSMQSAMSMAYVYMSRCDEVNQKRRTTADDVTPTSEVRSSHSRAETLSACKVKPEKLKLPSFSGNIRTFAKFKKDFAKIVVPFYTDEFQRAYVMKESCLKGIPKSLVENIDDLSDIWERLENKYGDVIDLVDVVIADLNEMQPLKGNDDQKFIELVDKLEKGLQDLEAIDARKELANAYTVKMVEKKLSRRIYMEWLKAEPSIEAGNRFDQLYHFLETERSRVEKLVRRNNDVSKPPPSKDVSSKEKMLKAGSYGANSGNDQKIGVQEENPKKEGGTNRRRNNCILHPDAGHFTRKCRTFLGKTTKERADVIKNNKACPFCLSITHQDKECPWKDKWERCNIDKCQKFHSHLLHDAENQGLICSFATCPTEVSNATVEVLDNRTLLQVQSIPTNHGDVVTFFDLGSTISLVSQSYAERNNLRGIPVSYELITVGGDRRHQATYLHEIYLKDREGGEHKVQAFQIEDVCGSLQDCNPSLLAAVFPELSAEDIQRPAGPIELLVGMPHANIHPTRINVAGNLVLYESIFGTGRVLGGTHPLLSSKDNLNSYADVVAHSQVMNTAVLCNVCRCKEHTLDFFSSEDLGVKVPRRCERCKNCKKCTTEIYQLSRIEQQELSVIEDNLVLDPIENRWKTSYPYKIDPSVLENNEMQAESLLLKQEKKFQNSKEDQSRYNDQFDDFIQREVFTEVTEEEMKNYKGPVFYVSHHAVHKEESVSTPIRLVINSSLKYRGHSLNDILMKGPNVLNDILGVQLRFRSYQIAVVSDIKKMYHSILTTTVERHLRRVKFRHFDSSKEIKTFGINTVMFGDRPASAIVPTAVKKTSEIYADINQEAAKKIIRDSYMDDTATGAETKEEVEDLKRGIKEILRRGGFQIKGFVESGEGSEEQLDLLGPGDIGKILGLYWNPKKDIFMVKVRINFSKKVKNQRTEKDLDAKDLPSILNMKITRRMLLSITNTCYDVFGELSPITVQLKIGLRRLNGVGWDEELSKDVKEQWLKILMNMKKAEEVTFGRCVRPKNSKGNPDLVMFNDGSEVAMCAAAYIRWKCEDGSVICRLWIAKTRVTPLKKLTIPRIEMQSAIMSVRLAEAIKKNSIWNFEEVYHVTDSKCLVATLSKNNAALGEFVGNRVAEILDTTTSNQWYHVKSKDNIADLATRENAAVEDIKEGSDWQNGPLWMYQPKESWPVDQDVGRTSIPEEFVIQNKIAASVVVEKPFMDYERYRGRILNFTRNIIARVIRTIRSKSFRNNQLSVEDLHQSDAVILKNSMKMTKEALDSGKLRSLRPIVKSDGTIVLGGRALEGMMQSYDNKEFPILTYKDPVAQMWMQQVHEEDHSGITKTVAKSRRRFWIIRARRLSTKVRRSCYQCRIMDKKLEAQQMAVLPRFRQSILPTFHEVSLDLFGPFEIHDTVKKRTRKKVWGIIINCLATRAVHVDVSESYETDGVILTLRRFISLRGCPATIHADKGSQLEAKEFDVWAVSQNIVLDLAPAEGQHHNGASESLIKSVKRSLSHVIGKTVLSFAELQTVFYEVADLVNSRPIGVVTGSDPEEPVPLTPNHLLLGRATSEVVSGLFADEKDVNKRHKFIRTIVDDWWKRWYSNVLPSLVPSYKWHHRQRNVKVGDVCLIKYKGELRGKYKLGRVTNVKSGNDGLVRTVKLCYRNSNESINREVDRPVQGIAVIVPIEEQNSSLNPKASEFIPS